MALDWNTEITGYYISGAVNQMESLQRELQDGISTSGKTMTDSRCCSTLCSGSLCFALLPRVGVCFCFSVADHFYRDEALISGLHWHPHWSSLSGKTAWTVHRILKIDVVRQARKRRPILNDLCYRWNLRVKNSKAEGWAVACLDKRSSHYA